MGKRIVFFSIILASILGLGAVLLASSPPAQGYAQRKSKEGNNGLKSLSRLNERARAAKGGQEGAVRALANDIFDTFGMRTESNAVMHPFQERIIQAELSYRNGTGQKIPEIKVVRMINGLVRKIGAPDYARTDLGEVRRLRMGLLTYLPALVEGEGKSSKREVGSSIDRSMSPLEAVYVTLLMLQQKQHNDEYQLSPSERTAARANNGKVRQEASNRRQTEPQLILRQATPREEEIAQVIRQGLAKKNSDELMKLANKSLDILGIGR